MPGRWLGQPTVALVALTRDVSATRTLHGAWWETLLGIEPITRRKPDMPSASASTRPNLVDSGRQADEGLGEDDHHGDQRRTDDGHDGRSRPDRCLRHTACSRVQGRNFVQNVAWPKLGRAPAC